MFWAAIVYLFGCLYLLIVQKINFDWKNLFNTDGMAVLGCGLMSIYWTQKIELFQATFLANNSTSFGVL